MLGTHKLTIDDPELCVAFVKYLKTIISISKGITPSYVNIDGKKDTHYTVMQDGVLVIGSDKSVSTNYIEINYEGVMAKYKRLREYLETSCPTGLTFKFSVNNINAWLKEYGERLTAVTIHEHAIVLTVYPKRIEKVLYVSPADRNYVSEIKDKIENRINMDEPLFVIERSEFVSEQLNMYDIPLTAPFLIGFNIDTGEHKFELSSLPKGKFPIFFRLFKNAFLKNVKTKDADNTMYLYADIEYPDAYILMHLVENKKYTGYQFFRVH